MHLLRPFFSHRLGPSSGIRTVVQSVEAGVLFFVFRVLSAWTGQWLFRDPVQWADELRFGVMLLVGAAVGGVIYSMLRTLTPRFGIQPTSGSRVGLVLLSGALLGALGSLVYWRRTPGPGEFSHLGFTALATIASAALALLLGAIVALQNRLERVTRAV